MNVEEVPQEGNITLEGHRKGVYARDAEGHLGLVASRGWEAEEIVTRQAVEMFDALTATARERVYAGQGSPLEYHMYRARMDIPLLAQASGVWQWRVRRHLRPEVFRKLPLALRARYAKALGLTPAQLDEPDGLD
ncbi:hypothetical protein AGMMS50256_27120 [Betaproteobacteria bacterium]|nr:hypothetical protein AGMMS50256_27120 [Betaproteobacteria bacterium]